MTQREILDFLEENPKGWFTQTEIEQKLGKLRGNLTDSMRSLRKHNEVQYHKRQISGGGVNPWEYKHKEIENSICSLVFGRQKCNSY